MGTIKLRRTAEAVDEVKDPETDEVTTESKPAEFAVVKDTTTEELENVSEEVIDNEILGLESRLKNRKALKVSLAAFKLLNTDEGSVDFDTSKQ